MISHQGNTNQRHNEIDFIATKMDSIRKPETNVGEDIKKLEPSYIANGMKNSTAALANSLAVPQMIKHRVSI